ncbi:hypothetical protein JB92DRAFT_156357 [Gautieria morchelliformis]|nr:hypothetical protein JB92DRAFT_156357 [Gautieria morchelliformis]
MRHSRGGGSDCLSDATYWQARHYSNPLTGSINPHGEVRKWYTDILTYLCGKSQSAMRGARLARALSRICGYRVMHVDTISQTVYHNSGYNRTHVAECRSTASVMHTLRPQLLSYHVVCRQTIAMRPLGAPDQARRILGTHSTARVHVAVTAQDAVPFHRVLYTHLGVRCHRSPIRRSELCPPQITSFADAEPGRSAVRFRTCSAS